MTLPLWFDSTKLFIGGAWCEAASGDTLAVIDPSHGTEIGRIASASAADVDSAVATAEAALTGDWGAQTAVERGRYLARLADLVTENAEALAQIEATDVGKPLRQAQNDVTALARYCEFYAGAADKIMGNTIPFQAGFTVYTLREPHGVTGHIIPWNYPLQIIGRSIGAALAMGNACVLKPAEEASLSALAFADLVRQAGLPDGAVNVLPGTGAVAGAAVAGHPGVRHVSFTGSVATGHLVQAAAAQNAVPVTLELGGKSPQLVFEDADLEAALPYLVNAGIQNAGQTCSAASRILVHESRMAEVAAAMAAAYQGLRAGPALDDLDVGPLISARQKAIVTRYTAMAEAGDILATGTVVPDAPEGGAYVAPMLLKGHDPMHALAQEEIFGPVQILLPFTDEADAIRIANATPYGLVAGIWTRDGARQARLPRLLRAGQVFVNNYGAAGGVELPFGGVGLSGHGREKGFEALYGFSALKTVALKYE